MPASDARVCDICAPHPCTGWVRAPLVRDRGGLLYGAAPRHGLAAKSSAWAGSRIPLHGVEAAPQHGLGSSHPHAPEVPSSVRAGSRPPRTGRTPRPPTLATYTARKPPPTRTDRKLPPPHRQDAASPLPSPRTPWKPRPLYGLAAAPLPPHRQDATPPHAGRKPRPHTRPGSPTPARPGTPIPLTGWKWGKPGRGGSGGPTLDLCRALRVGCLLWTTTRSSGS